MAPNVCNDENTLNLPLVKVWRQLLKALKGTKVDRVLDTRRSLSAPDESETVNLGFGVRALFQPMQLSAFGIIQLHR